MFAFSKDEPASSKCYFVHSKPSQTNRDQPSTKKRPFTTISSYAFSHTVDLVLPEELYEIIQQDLNGDAGTLRYARVNMSLSEIITGDFFNHYIKTGNILMLSEGRPTVDNVFSLRDGILRLELDRPTYERCGLAGKPIPDGGRKHTKARYAVELNLRLPSMLRGKKGFERIVWAFKNVLNHSVTWLFHDLLGKDDVAGPISKHHPFEKTVPPIVTHMHNVLVPPMKPVENLTSAQNSMELLEWLGLLSLDSPRIYANDKIDPYLSRYEIPSFDVDEAPASQNLVRLRWHGFADPRFITKIWIIVTKAAEGHWTALNVASFGGTAYSVLNVGNEDCLTWECD